MRQAGGNGVHLLLRLFDGYAGLEPPRHDERAELTIPDLLGSKRERDPQIGGTPVLRPRRQHANNGVRFRIQTDVAADDRGIGAHAPPKPVAEKRHLIFARPILVGSEIPSEPDTLAEHPIAAGRGLPRAHALRRLRRGEIEVARPERLEILERCRLPLPIQVFSG